MGTALTGLQIGSTYNGLLKTTDNAVVNGTLRVITDGLGNDTALSVSTAGIKATGTLEVTGVATLGANAILNTPASGNLTNCTGLPVSTGVSGLGTGVATALAVNVGSAGAPVVNGGALGTPSSGTLTSCTGLPVSTGISGLGTGVATALAVNVGSAGAPVVNGGALGTPSSGTVTNLTGTASININGTVGATTPAAGSFTTLSATSTVSFPGLKGQKTTATSGFVSCIDEGANTYNVFASRNNADSAYLPLNIRGTTITLQSSTTDIATISSTGLAVTGTLGATGLLTVGGSTPASAAASGTAGTITWDASYIYVCTATNTWKRVAIATW